MLESAQGVVSLNLHYPSELFDQIIDILTDMVLEDMKQFLRLPLQSIDRITGRENTSPATNG